VGGTFSHFWSNEANQNPFTARENI